VSYRVVLHDNFSSLKETTQNTPGFVTRKKDADESVKKRKETLQVVLKGGEPMNFCMPVTQPNIFTKMV